MGRTWPLICLVIGCGRIGFDAADDGSTLPDVSIPASCASLAPTCGPSGASPCCESLVIPGGTYFRGYDVTGDGFASDMSYPASVSDFRLDKYKVTVGRFRQFIEAGMGTQASPPAAGAGGRTLNGAESQGGWDASWNASLAADTSALIAGLHGESMCSTSTSTWTDAPAGNENRPMDCITWYEAMAFCIWDGGFLPTEAQWNYGAAGGDEQRAYPWSNPPSSLAIDADHSSYWDGTNCLGDNMPGCAVTDNSPVGSKPAGDGRWGHSDLAGNGWEWVLDANQPSMAYSNPCDDCANLDASFGKRMSRAGSPYNNATAVRTASHFGFGPTERWNGVVVRCAREAP